MAAEAAPGEQPGPVQTQRSAEIADDDDDDNIFTRTLAALETLAADLSSYAGRLPTEDALNARQRILAQNGGCVGQVIGPGTPMEMRIGKRVGEGTFCVVFSATLPTDNLPVAIKLELRKVDCPQLRNEFRTYGTLHAKYNNPGFTRALYFGDLDFHKTLVMDLLGPSLESLFFACGKRFSVKTVAMLARQMISRLQVVHENGLIYRDIKPENFLLGVPGTDKAGIVHLVDFGMAKQYIDPATGSHIKPTGSRSMNGTVRYMSINAHQRQTQSRRDDIEALGHVLVFLARGRLPWQGLKGENHEQRRERMLERKIATKVPDLCEGLPHEFMTYMMYARALPFDAEPNYDYLRALFNKVLIDLGTTDDGIFDWVPASPSESKAEPAKAIEVPADSARKTQPFFYDSLTQQALAALHRDIMAHRYKFHRSVGAVDVGRCSRVSGALRTTAAAATKAASALVSGVAAHTASLPSYSYTRPIVQPITDLLASLTSDGKSDSNIVAPPSVVISTSFTDFLDQRLIKATAELEDMGDKHLQYGDWTPGRTRVCGWVDEVAAAVPQEQERVRAEYAKWKEAERAAKLQGITGAQTGHAAPAAPQNADHGLQMDSGGGFGSLEVDTLEVDDQAKGPEPMVPDTAGILSVGDFPVPASLAGPPLGGDGHDDADGNDSDNPDVFNLVFRTASGSRKVVRMNK